MSIREQTDRFDDPDLDEEELRMELALLAEKNRKLRASYPRDRQSRYRRTAIGLGVLGGLAIGGTLLFPAAQTVLFVLAGIGLFGAVLTYFLTPEQFVPASVGGGMYGTLTDLEASIVAQLGLAEPRVYVPIEQGQGSETSVRLYIPQRESYVLPDRAALVSPIVVTDDEREFGVSFPPTGTSLFDEFDRMLSGPLADEPVRLVDQLLEGVVDGFELAAAADADVDPDGQVTVRLTESTFGPIDRIDHPAVSFLAVGLATTLDVPIKAEVTRSDEPGGETDPLLVFYWE